MSQQNGVPLLRPLQETSKINEQLEALAKSPEIRRIYQALGNDADLYIVGGVIRDIALGKNINDIDLASVLKPDVAIARLNKAEINSYTTGLEHGTITINLNKKNFELTTFRLASVREKSEFSNSIFEDLGGRDFTVNALAFSVKENKLIDPLLGLRDLEKNLLKAVNSAEDRILEDPLRILRAFRFGPANGLNLDQDLLQAILKQKKLLKEVSIERIRDEIIKIVMSQFPRTAFQKMYEVGVLEIVLPEFLQVFNFEQNEFHTEDVFNHIMSVVERAKNTEVQKLSALFHDIGKPQSLSIDENGKRHFYNHETIGANITRQVMQRLKFSNSLTDKVSKLVLFHMRPLNCGPSAVRRLIRDLGDDFNDWLLLKIADKSPTISEQGFQSEYDGFVNLLNIEKQRQASPVYGKMAIDGDDLKQMGFSEGILIGKVLKYLNEILMEEPEKNNKEYLEQKARDILNDKIKL